MLGAIEQRPAWHTGNQRLPVRGQPGPLFNFQKPHRPR